MKLCGTAREGVSGFPRAEHAPELLDERQHDNDVLEQSLHQVAQVNRWLGGARALLLHLAPLLEASRRTRILDVGSASGDLPRRIAQLARARGLAVEIVASDLHPQMRALAARECADYGEIEIAEADALALPFAYDAFDVVTLSMTLHHFDGAQQIDVLREAGRVARSAVIVNELRRSRLNYAGARLMAATLWRGNPLTRHDGPLSVKRAFTPDELGQLCARAGINGAVHTHYFQRIVFAGRPE